MSNYIEGKFASYDYSFCTNMKCKKRKKCARAWERYPELKGKRVSMSNFICGEDKQ